MKPSAVKQKRSSLVFKPLVSAAKKSITKGTSTTESKQNSKQKTRDTLKKDPVISTPTPSWIKSDNRKLKIEDSTLKIEARKSNNKKVSPSTLNHQKTTLHPLLSTVKKSDTPILRDSDTLMHIGNAAKFLKVSIDTLRRWEKMGKISPTRTPGGTRLYSKEVLEQAKTPDVKSGNNKTSGVESLFSISEAAKRLGVSTKTLRRWDEAGKLIASRNKEGERVYKETEIEEFTGKSQETEARRHLNVRQGDALPSSTSQIEPEIITIATYELSQSLPQYIKRVSVFAAAALVITLLLTSSLVAGYFTKPQMMGRLFAAQGQVSGIKYQGPQTEKISKELASNQSAVDTIRAQQQILGESTSSSRNTYYSLLNTFLSPFNNLAQNIIEAVAPAKARDLGFYQKNTDARFDLDERAIIEVDDKTIAAKEELSEKLSQTASTINHELITMNSQINSTTVNLLRNSSFEKNASGQPDSWFYVNESASNNTIVNNASVRTGNHALLLEPKNGRENFGIYQPYFVTKFERPYTLSLYLDNQSAQTFTLKLGFWDKNNNRRIAAKDIEVASSPGWKRYSYTLDPPDEGVTGLDFYPMIEALGLSAKNVFIDDIQLEEGEAASTYEQENMTAGDGSIAIDANGNITPTTSRTGSLGTDSFRFGSLYLTKAHIDNDGNANFGGSLTVASSATIAADLTVNGDDIQSSSSTFRLFPENVLNLTIGGSATAIGIGSANGTTTINNNLAVTGTSTFTGSTTFTGGIALPDGSSSTPALRFTNDTDSGLYRLTANTLRLTTAGSANNGVTINSVGNVGIGNTSPLELLEAGTTNTASDNYLRVSAAGGNAYRAGIKMRVYNEINGATIEYDNRLPVGLNFLLHDNDAAGQSAMFIAYNTRYVGIGTTAPGNLLTVNGNVGIGTTAFVNAGLSVMTGNVGIGTTSPSQKLDVAGSANLSTGNTYKIAGTDVLSSTVLGSGVVTSSLTTVGALASGSIASGFGTISTGNTITTTGTMGTAATTTFTGAGGTFSANVNANGGLDIDDAFVVADGGALTTSQAATFNGNVFFGTSTGILNATTGNVGIGTTSPGALFDISGNTASMRFTETGTGARTWEVGSGVVSNGFLSFYDVTYPNESVLTLDTSRRIGVRDTAPNAVFEISGDGDVTNDLFMVSSSNTKNGDRFIVKNGGNVGIGTTAPSALLEVNGALKATTFNGNTITTGTGTLTMSAGKTLTVSDSTTLGTNAITFGGAEVLTLAAAKNVTFADAFVTSGAYSLTLTTTGTTNVTLPTTGTLSTLAGTETLSGKTFTGNTFFPGPGIWDTNGNVGIGTTTPGANTRLSVMGGNVGIGTTSPGGTLELAQGLTGASSGTNYILKIDPTLSGAVNTTAMTSLYGTYSVPAINLSGTSGTLTNWYGNYVGGSVGTGTTSTVTNWNGIYVASPTTSATGTITNKYALVTEASAGNIGIGTTTSTLSRMTVAGGSATTGLAFLVQDSAYANRFAIQGNGNVGIGTTVPLDKLEVTGTTGSGLVIGIPTSTVTDGYVVGQIAFRSRDDSGVASNDLLPSIKALMRTSATDPANIGAWANEGNDLAFFTSKRPSNDAAVTISEIMRLTKDGNVGIGSDDTPDYQLELYDGTNTPTFGMSDDDVAHSFTDLVNADTFAHLTSLSTTAGGGLLQSFSDGDASGFNLKVGIGITNPTDSTPAIKLIGGKLSGTTLGDLAAAETVFQIANNDDAPALSVMGSGNIGIGTTTSTLSRLTIAGGSATTGLAFLVQDSAYTNRFAIQGDGNVGIGTTAPTALLEVNGALKATTFNGNTITTGTGTLTMSAGKTLTVSDSTTLGTNAITFGGAEVLTLAAAKNVTFADAFVTSGAYSLTLTTTGTTNVTLPTTGTMATLAGTETLSGKTFSGNTFFPGPGIWDTNGNVGIGTTTPGANTRLSVMGGNVGIGTTAPAEKLQIVGGRLRLPQTNEPTTPTLNFGDGDSGLYEVADDQIWMAISGTNSVKFTFESTLFGSGDDGNANIMIEVPTATNPVYSFYNDADTGIGWAGANILSLIAGGTNGLNVNSSGNVGIGTTSPGGTLELAQGLTGASSGTNYILKIDPTLSGAVNTTAMTSLYGTYSVPAINLSGTSGTLTNWYGNYVGGSVGTGTTTTVTNWNGIYVASPTTSATGTITNKYALVTEASAGNIGIGTTTSTLSRLTIAGGSATTGLAFLVQDSAYANRFAIQGNGNVGIGTTSPLAALEVKSDTGLYLGAGSDLQLTLSNDDLYFKQATQDKDVYFQVNDGGTNTNLMFFDGSTSQIGIGTTAPGYALDIQNGDLRIGSGSTTFLLMDNVGVINSSSNLRFDAGTFGTNATKMFIEASSGNVGIGTTGPTSLLHVTGTSPASVSDATGTTAISVLNITGAVGGSTTIATTGTGGIGSAISLTAGDGGLASSANTLSTGGIGGGLSLAAGIGGASNVASGNRQGGNGGNLTLAAGGGGRASSGGTSGIAGNGGYIEILGGFGGWGANTDGSGGNVYIAGGGRSAGSGGPFGHVILGVAADGTLQGNVGIGTTSPLGTLHVAGQCVAKGTRIRRRRKGKNGEWEEDDIPVENIKPGDEVLSLNDKTGAFEWHQVEKTMDMGKQEIWKLITQSGKMIETTDAHPYLTIEKHIKRIPESGKFEVDLSTRMEKNADTFVAIANKTAAEVIKVTALQKQALKKLFAKTPRLFSPTLYALCIVEIISRGKIRPSQLKICTDYPSHERRIEAIISHFYPGIIITTQSVGRNSPAHLAVLEAFRNQNKKTGAGSNLQGFPAAEQLHDEWLHRSTTHTVLMDKDYHKFTDLSMENATWKKVKYLKPGDIIATTSGWEKIQAKYSTGRKQTYDLQIEGTHNFVGNNIVAHNTAIFGAGEGGTPTTTTLRGAAGSGTNIAGANLTFDASNGTGTGGSGALIFRTAPVGTTGTTANTLAEIMRITPGGNVGIGTTAPGQKLDLLTGSSYGIGGTAVLSGTTLGSGVVTSSLTTVGALASGSIASGFGTISTGNTITTTGTMGTAATTTFTGAGGTFSANVNANGGLDIDDAFVVADGGALTTSQAATFNGNVFFGTSTGILNATTGNVGIGTTSPGGTLELAQGLTGASSGTNYILKIDPTLSGAVNTTAMTSLYGTYSVPAINLSGTSGTLTNWYGNYVGGSVGTGTTTTVTNWNGIYVASPTTSATGTITNKYALITEASAGNVGIGTTTSTLSRLTIAGGSATTGLAFLVQDSAYANRFAIQGDGNVGIGTTAPGEALEVNGDMQLQNNTYLYGKNTSGTQTGLIGTDANNLTKLSASHHAYFGNSLGVNATLTSAPASPFVVNGGMSIGAGYYTTAAPTNGAIIQGNVGIGTSSPESALLTLSKTEDTTYAASTIYNYTGALKIYNQSVTDNTVSVLNFVNRASGGTAHSAIVGLSPSADNSVLTFITEGANTVAERMRIDQNGNVGIGTTSPVSLLQLRTAASSDPSFSLADGDVAHGVTTIAPTDDFLRIVPISSTVGGAYINGLADATGVALQLRGIQSSDPTDSTPAIKLIGAKASGTGVQDLGAAETVFQVANNDDAAALSVMGNGRIGIGTTGPSSIVNISAAGTATVTLQNSANSISSKWQTTTTAVELTTEGAYPMIFYYSGADKIYMGSNIGLFGNQTFGTNAVGVLGIKNAGQRSETPVADVVQLWSYDYAASDARLYIQSEAQTSDDAMILGNKALIGGQLASGNLTLESTSNATKGNIILNPTSGNVGIGTTSPGGTLELAQGLTGASSGTNYILKIDPTLSGAVNTTAMTSLYGTYSVPAINLSGTSGTLTNWYGNYVGGSVGTGTTTTVTNWNGIYVASPTTSATGTITNKYALVTEASAGNIGIGTTTSTLSRMTVAGGSTTTGLAFLVQDSAYANRFAIQGNGNVGIGTTAPTQKLDVVGTININTGDLKLSNTQNIWWGDTYAGIEGDGGSTTNYLRFKTGNAESMRIDKNGNVGIGTTNPGTLLSLGSSSGTLRQVFQANNDGGGSLGIWTDDDASNYNLNNSNLSGNYVLKVGTVNGSPFNSAVFAGGVNLAVTAGNVGIGTTSPGGTLELAQGLTGASSGTNYILKIDPTLSGAVNTTAMTSLYGTYSVPAVNLSGTSGTLTNWYGNYVGGSVGTGTTTTVTNWNGIYVASPTTSATGTITNKYALVTEASAGNIGIGTTTSTLSRMTVAGGSATTGLAFLVQDSAYANRFAIQGNGNVGIGTTAPTYKLDVLDLTTGGGSHDVLRVAQEGAAAAGNSANILFDASSTNNSYNAAQGRIRGIDAGDHGLDFAFDLHENTQSSNIYERMRITSYGNVGIGTTSPVSLLQLRTAASSDPSFSLADGDVAHGVTTIAPTDDFLRIVPISSTVGGAYINGLADATGVALQLRGIQSSDPTDSTPAIFLVGAKASGTGVVDLGATETIFQVANNDDAAALTILGNGNVGIGTTGPAELFQIMTGSTNLFKVNTGGAGTFGGAVFATGVTVTESNLVIPAGSKFLLDSGGDTYFIETSANNVDIFTGGTQRMRWDSAGNVGIGTTAPGGTLELAQGLTGASSGTNYILKIDPTLSGAVNTTAMTSLYGTYSVPAINLSGTSGTLTNWYGNYIGGSVGTGTTTTVTNWNGIYVASPTTSATGTITNKYALITEASAGNIGIGTTTSTLSRLTIAGGGTGANLAFLVQDSAYANRFAIQGDGNVGIGTTAPISKLDVYGADSIFYVRSSGTNTPQAFIQPTGGTTPNVYFGTNTATANLNLQAGNATAMTLLANGNVGIGTTSPGAKLDLASTSTTGPDFRITNTGAVTGTVASLVADSLTTGTLLDLSLDALTTGKGINLTSTSNAIDSGILLNVSSSSTAATDTSLSADIANLSFAPIYSTAVTTPSVTGQVLDISRTVTTNALFASTLTLSGAVATFSDTATQTTGTLTSTADVIQISQNYTGNSGAALNITTASTNTSAFALRVNDDGTLTDSTPFVVDYAGNVGIGTTAPGQRLDLLTGSSYGIAGTAVLSGTTLGTGVLTSSLTTVGALASGSIASGFGTISTGNTITTTGTMGTAGTTTFTGAGGTFSANVNANGGLDIDDAFVVADGGALTTSQAATFNGNLFFGTSTGILASGGNVGIGTTGPLALLNVNGGTIRSDTGNIVGMEFYRNGNLNGRIGPTNNFITGGNGYDFGISAAGTGDGTGGHLLFATGTTEHMRIDTNGNVGIGTTSPLALTHIYQTGSADALRVDDSAADTTYFVVDQYGNVGIGTTSPTYKLDVTGDGRLTTGLTVGTTAANSTARASLTINGDETIKGKVDLVTSGLSGVTDVYVYDTTKDSDGGKWRNDERAKASSWYNETIDNTGAACTNDTDDRCGRKEFPEKAIIVATSTDLYIFDAKDNTQWMNFDTNGAWQASSNAIGISGTSIDSVYALNGVLYATLSTGNEALARLDFKKDESLFYRSGDGPHKYNAGLGSRNAGSGHTNLGYGASWYILDITNGPNDVFARTINGKTYVAVATDAGFSVINETDQVIYDYADNALDDYNQVWLDGSGNLWATNETTGTLEKWNNVINDSADENPGTPDSTWDETTTPALAASAPTIQVAPGALYGTDGTSTVDGKSPTVYIGTDKGLTVLQTKAGSETAGSVKYYTKTHITEEMVGDTRGMWSFSVDGSDAALGSTVAAASTLGDASLKNSDLTVFGNTMNVVTGVRGKALQFDGSTNYLKSTATTFSPGTGSMSAGAWINASSALPDGVILHSGNNDTSNTYWRLFIGWGGDNQNKVAFGIHDGTTGSGSGSSPMAVNDDKWHFVVGVRDTVTDKVYIYVDGVQVNSGTDNSGNVDTSTLGLWVGVRGDGGTLGLKLNGSLDEPFVTMSALTPGEIKHMYEVGKRALDEHTASRITGVTGADNYQRLMGNASGGTTTSNTVKAVAVDSSNQFIYAGVSDATTNTGGVTVLGVDSDSAVDLYDGTANTGKDDDAGTQFSANDVVAISLSGTPIHAYNSGTSTSNNGAVIAIAGTNDTATRAWMQSNDYSLYSTLAQLTSPDMVKDSITATNIFKVFNTYNNITNATTGERIETPALSVDSGGNLVYNYLGTSTSATALDFNDSVLTTGSMMDLTSTTLTTGTVLGLTANALTSGTGLNISSSATAMTGTLEKITLSGSNAANTGSLLELLNSGTANANTSLYIKHYATGTGNYALRVDDVSGDTSPFVIQGDGNVGIGTTSPGDLIHVRNGSGVANLRLEGNSGNPGLMFYVGSTLKAQIYEESGDDTLRLGTGTGAQTDLVIASNGNIGIGITSPLYSLDVSKSAAGGPVIAAIRNTDNTADSNSRLVIQSGGSSAGDAYVHLAVAGTSTEWAFGIDNSDSDKFKLATNGDLNVANVLTADLGGNIGINTTTPGNRFTVNGNVGIGTTAAINAQLAVMSGNVGIGTTSPGALLHVNGTMRATQIGTSANPVSYQYNDRLWLSTVGSGIEWTDIVSANIHILNSALFFGVDTGAGRSFVFGASPYRSNNYDHGTQTNPTLFIQDVTDPNVTNNKWGSLSHDGTGLVITSGANTGAGTTPATIDNYIAFAPRGTEQVRINGSGNVGIGTTAPAHKIDVVGTAGLSTGTAWTNTSDARFKNIQSELNGSSLDKVIALRPVSYTWNELHDTKYGADPGTNFGFIAQEVAEIIPEFIGETSDGYLTYNPSGIEAILTAAIQEQQGQINSIKGDVLSILGTEATQSAAIAALQNKTANLSVAESGVISSGVGFDSPEVSTGQLLVSGNVGIGTTDPGAYKLAVNGPGFLNDTGWTYASDRRLKDNITEIGAGIAVINALNPVTFDYINGGQNRSGFIAQEVQQILPSIVSQRADGMLALRTEEIVPYTVKAIQELNDQVAKLQDSLQMEADGTLNVSAIKAGKLLLANISLEETGLTSNGSSLTTVDPEGYSQPVSQTQFEETVASIKYQVSRVDELTDKMKALEDRITQLEASQSAQVAGIQTSTPSAEIAALPNVTPTPTPTATTSAQLVITLSEQEASRSATSSASLILNTDPLPLDMELTSPDVLLATSSAILTNLQVQSDATFSGKLQAYEAIISDTFKSFGQTFLGNTTVAGDFSIDGTMSITGNSINSIGASPDGGPQGLLGGGTLYIQNSPLATAIDFFNGQVTIDKTGKLTAQEIVTNVVTAGQVNIIEQGSSSTIGTSTLPANQTRVAVFTDKVTQGSKIFITPRASTSGQALFVEAMEPGVGFVVSIDQALTHDLDFDWWIIEVK